MLSRSPSGRGEEVELSIPFSSDTRGQVGSSGKGRALLAFQNESLFRNPGLSPRANSTEEEHLDIVAQSMSAAAPGPEGPRTGGDARLQGSDAVVMARVEKAIMSVTSKSKQQLAEYKMTR